MNKPLFILLLFSLFILIDLYVFQGLKLFIMHLSVKVRNALKIAFWSFTILCLSTFLLYHLSSQDAMGIPLRTFIRAGLFITYISKIVFIFFLLLDDLQRLLRWCYVEGKGLIPGKELVVEPDENHISRSQFLATTGILVASVPFISLNWGIISGAHDYRIRKVEVPLKNLPSALDGLRIVQISDIHAGSFWNKTAVKAGVEMAVGLKADMIFFTGDLVNNRSDEMAEWISVFSKLTAPLGVYSVLGNHDYGDYYTWNSVQEKEQNFKDILHIHKILGWDLLMDENRIMNIQGEKLAIIGVQNWGAKARFPRYGNLAKANMGTEDINMKLLLTHDPSHWQAQVLTQHPDIDVTFAGHTHGMQFGVEIPGFKWSPVQYMYDEWAGLYQEKENFLYVNRGFGYIGYPGRVGILPEISLITLKKQS